MAQALSLVRQLLWRGCYAFTVSLGGTGKDVGKRHPTVREGALVSAHAQVIGPIEIGKNSRSVRQLWICADPRRYF